jgi:5-methylcytosine-specific restriction endonuclease McrBC regulatory subunit McrC
MRISVPVNHNFYEELPIIGESKLCAEFSVKETKRNKGQLQQIFSSVYELKLGAEQLKQVKIFNFKRNRFFEQDDERLILKLYSKEKTEQEKEYIIQTGLYAGVLFHKSCKINITTKYGDTFLKRMLNFVNDIYVDNEQIKAKKDETENQFLFIIAHLFIQSLEKSVVLGLPQQYQKHQERSHKVRGRIDFNEYLKRDVPFQGKLTTTFRERIYVQEIVDVLYLALRKLESVFGKEIHSRLLGLNQLLKQQYSGRFASYETIQKAKTHQSINNAMYSGFKKVLEYAEIILLNKDLMPDNEKQNLATTGYLFDIAELYELYLEKLLSRNFPEWFVNGQIEIPIYQTQFYRRSMFPDLILKHKKSGKIIALDAKFKKMEMQNKDVDRADLHQIHSYSGYYQNSLIASGLIYPLSKQIDIKKTHADTLYGSNNNDVCFIVDGVFVHDNQTMEQLIENENKFIERISDLTKKQEKKQEIKQRTANN